jgi:hypothetical protein
LIITFLDLSVKYDLNQFKDKSSSLYTFNFDNKIVWLTNDVQYEKLLGITIDNCFSWCQQINNIVSKISSRLGLMCRLRTYLPTEGLIVYYNGYILPLFDYCCTVLEKLCKLQKRAARIILWYDHK